MRVGDRVKVNSTGEEGMVLLRLVNGKIVVRHMCNNGHGYWDCFDREYLPEELRPLGFLLKMWRGVFPGYLTTHEYLPLHNYSPDDIEDTQL